MYTEGNLCNQLPKGMFVFQQNILQSKFFMNIDVHFIFLLCTVVDVKDGEFSPVSTLCLFYMLCKRHLRSIYVEMYDSNQSVGLFFWWGNQELQYSITVSDTNAVNSWLRGFLVAFLCVFFWKMEEERYVCFRNAYMVWRHTAKPALFISEGTDLSMQYSSSIWK